MKYFALSNIEHDGKTYRRGDAIDVSDKQAEDLLEAGVIQKEKVADARERASAAPEEETHQPKVGGDRAESGEPSLDTPEVPQRAEAEDVSPKVSESMKRDELEKVARKQGIAKEDIAAAATKADLVSLIEKPAPSESSEVDASANL